MRMNVMIATAVGLLAGTALAAADAAPTRDDAVAMVKKAVALIKAEGNDKAYADMNKGGEFLHGEVYVVVVSPNGTTLVQPANTKLISKNLMDVPDVDGKFFVKEMVEKASAQQSFWMTYKFANPATKKIQPKDMYCESVDKNAVCAGIYRP